MQEHGLTDEELILLGNKGLTDEELASLERKRLVHLVHPAVRAMLEKRGSPDSLVSRYGLMPLLTYRLIKQPNRESAAAWWQNLQDYAYRTGHPEMLEATVMAMSKIPEAGHMILELITYVRGGGMSCRPRLKRPK